MAGIRWWTRLARWCDRQLLRSLPEYHLFEREESRLRAIKELDAELAGARSFNRGVVWIVVAAVISANGSICVVPMLSPWRWKGQGSVAAATIAVGAFAGIVWVWRRGVARRLRGKLVESGVPVCRACGYFMKGLRERSKGESNEARDVMRCPECGTPAEDAVRAMLQQSGK